MMALPPAQPEQDAIVHIPERLKLRLYDLTAPALDPVAKANISKGKKAVRAGDHQTALTHFAQAVSQDGRSFLRPWGLPPTTAQGQYDAIRNRMQTRLKSWYSSEAPQKPPPVARLADKVALRLWAKEQTDCRIPTPLGRYEGFDDVLWQDFHGQSMVIKPRHGEMARGVLVLKNGFDLMRHQEVGPSLKDYAAKIWQEENVRKGEILAEALVQDPAPNTAIPRDFKGFCALGKVAYITIQDTNGSAGYQNFRQRRAFDAKGNPVPRAHGEVPDCGATALPDRYFEIVEAMERLSTIFPQALRLDFYLDHDGPVLGEITTYPNAGLGFAPFSARTFHQMLDVTQHLE